MTECQMAGYKQFTDWSNTTWHMGNCTQETPQKSWPFLQKTAEYTADPVKCYAG